MDLMLAGKIALITGASRGLGFATARYLAQEGATVVLNSRNSEKLSAAAHQIEQETHLSVLALPGDVTNPKTPDQLIDQIKQQFGALDILIANAGGPPPGPFDSFDDAAWYKAIDLSFMSQVRLIRAALPLLKQSSSASVLTITSYSVKQPIPNLVLSNSVRAATVGLTKTLALELGNQGIRFNSILPGWTETERVSELMSKRAAANGTSIEEELAKQIKDSPLGRMATPDEFARVAVFLVSPAASYLTGVMLPVDGGMLKGTL
jgi:3-oxoacyl-[acyl-carrier protein] reductase